MTQHSTFPHARPCRSHRGLIAAGLLASTLAIGACGGPPDPASVTPAQRPGSSAQDGPTEALAAALAQQTGRRVVADRVAVAVTREATRHQMEPTLLAGVLVTENAHLDTAVVSRSGAVGLMQVMRFHAGAYDCGSRNLKQIDANVCHGAHVLNGYLRASPDVREALMRYNGCVRRGRHARRCERYPARVLRNASRLKAAMQRK